MARGVEDRGEAGGGGYSDNTDIIRWDPQPGPWVRVLSDTAEGHNINIATRGIYDPSELDIIFVGFSL